MGNVEDELDDCEQNANYTNKQSNKQIKEYLMKNKSTGQGVMTN